MDQKEIFCYVMPRIRYFSNYRRHLQKSGVAVESSKGEAGPGQHELNVRYCEVVAMADNTVVYKQCIKEVAEQVCCPYTSKNCYIPSISIIVYTLYLWLQPLCCFLLKWSESDTYVRFVDSSFAHHQ